MKNEVYILIDALEKKQNILRDILKASEDQYNLVTSEDFDLSDFDQLVDKKSELLDQMEKIDEAFDSIFKKIKTELLDQKEEYKSEIVKIQELIQMNLDTGSEIHMKENSTKDKLFESLKNEKKRLTKEKADGNSVMRYYQQANQHLFVEPAFLDQKK